MTNILQSIRTSVKYIATARPQGGIHNNTADNLDYYRLENEEVIKQRIDELNDEWDIERSAELNAGLATLLGLVLGVALSKKWLMLPAAIGGFFVWHALKGKSDSLPATNQFRSRKEIAGEQFGLNEILRNGTNAKHDY